MKKKRKKIKEDGEGAPANNIGSGNIATPEPSLFSRKDATEMKKKRDEDLKKFSDFLK